MSYINANELTTEHLGSGADDADLEIAQQLLRNNDYPDDEAGFDKLLRGVAEERERLDSICKKRGLVLGVDVASRMETMAGDTLEWRDREETPIHIETYCEHPGNIKPSGLYSFDSDSLRCARDDGTIDDVDNFVAFLREEAE